MRLLQLFTFLTVSFCSLQAHLHQAVHERLLQNYGTTTSLSYNQEATPSQSHDAAISKYDLYKTALTMCMTDDAKAGSVLSKESMIDLSLFFHSSTQPDYTVLEHLYRGETISGKVVCSHQLATPIEDISVLIRRQKSIQWLLEHPKKRDELLRLLSSIRESEEQVLSLLNPADSIYSKPIEALYFNGNMRALTTIQMLLFDLNAIADFKMPVYSCHLFQYSSAWDTMQHIKTKWFHSIKIE